MTFLTYHYYTQIKLRTGVLIFLEGVTDRFDYPEEPEGFQEDR